jgi:hypothetical protein
VKRRVLAIVVGLLLVLGMVAPAAVAPAFAQDGDGILTGRLVNGTPGGGSVAGQEVTLITYLNGSPLTDTPKTQTDTDGRFSFSGLATGTDYGYDPVASYQGVNYWSELPDTGELPAFPPGQTTMEVTINVYDTTRDESSVFLMLGHIILSAESGSVEVTEYYVFVTTDNRTFIGRDGETGVLHFPLPSGAAGLQLTFGPGQSQVVTEAGGFWDKRPVPPDGSEVGYSYSLTPRSGKVDFVRPIDYPTARIDIVVPEGTLDVAGPGIVPDESMNISGNVYAHYSVDELAPGQDLTMVISGASGGRPVVVWLAIAGLLLVIVVFAVVYVLRKRRPAAVPAGVEGVPPPQQLLAELAELDDRFDAGEIDEAAYRKLRDSKKAELAKLMRSTRGE